MRLKAPVEWKVGGSARYDSSCRRHLQVRTGWGATCKPQTDKIVFSSSYSIILCAESSEQRVWPLILSSLCPWTVCLALAKHEWRLKAWLHHKTLRLKRIHTSCWVTAGHVRWMLVDEKHIEVWAINADTVMWFASGTRLGDISAMESNGRLSGGRHREGSHRNLGHACCEEGPRVLRTCIEGWMPGVERKPDFFWIRRLSHHPLGY